MGMEKRISHQLLNVSWLNRLDTLQIEEDHSQKSPLLNEPGQDTRFGSGEAKRHARKRRTHPPGAAFPFARGFRRLDTLCDAYRVREVPLYAKAQKSKIGMIDAQLT
jgi:hypothetical protein